MNLQAFIEDLISVANIDLPMACARMMMDGYYIRELDYVLDLPFDDLHDIYGILLDYGETTKAERVKGYALEVYGDDYKNQVLDW